MAASSAVPGSRAVRPLLQPADRLADRYVLVAPVDAATPGGENGAAVLWRADDEVLARPVALKVMSAGGRKGGLASKRFLDAASTAGTLLSPVLARVYDAAVEERPAQQYGRPAGDIDVAYVISEWVDGPTLAESLATDGPMAPREACALATTISEALTLAHTRGIAHGRLHPGNVLLPVGGGVKVTDLAVSAALPEQQVSSVRAGDPEACAADVRDLSAILYACLTARWPASATPQPSGGVPAAPSGHDGPRRGKLISPRQVRAGVPRALDAVVARALDPARVSEVPALTSAAALADALEGAVRADTPRVRGARRRRVPRWVWRLLPVVLSLAFLAAVGFGAYAAGKRVGELPPEESEALVSAAPEAPRRTGTAIDLTGVPVSAFDPEPQGDGGENNGAVPGAHDGDDATEWTTEDYDSDTFAGQKQGVGLLVDLGEPTSVGQVEVATSTPGMAVELRAADQQGTLATDYRVVARGTQTDGAIVFEPGNGNASRFYLVWITGLQEVDGSFRGAVAELRFSLA